MRRDPRTRSWCGALQSLEVVGLKSDQPRRLRGSNSEGEKKLREDGVRGQLKYCSRKGQRQIGINGAGRMSKIRTEKRSLALAVQMPW